MKYKNFIVMKFYLKNKGYHYKDIIKFNLKEENKNIEIIYKEKYNDELTKIEHELFGINKSNDNLSEFYFLSQSEMKGYNYYMKKAKEEFDLSKRADYLWELINNLKS